jgi:inhibitor of nuclear factor kappa-B kinase subunit alpha
MSNSRKADCGRKRSARTLANIERVEELICSQNSNPGTSKSPREIERATGISRSTVRRIAKHDLNLKVYRRREVQKLSDADSTKRFAACKRLKQRMTDEKIDRTWFTDEKIFTVQTPTNTQNDRVYANVRFKRDVTPARLLKGRKHFSQSVMVSLAVSKLGKTAPFFVTPKAKVNSVYYCDEVLAQGLLPDIRQLSGVDGYVFQQDGAPAHRSRHTVAYLKANVPEFIEPENWPPNSPDLNPVDYSIWGCLQQLVYREPIRDVDHLKRVIILRWAEISQALVDSAIDQWSRRVNAVILAHGGHIEHLFD